MIHLLSPAKSLDYSFDASSFDYTLPGYLDNSAKIIAKLKSWSAKKIKQEMSISDALVQLNVERYRNWEGLTHYTETCKPAIFVFSGDVYLGLNARELKKKDLDFAQSHLRILSGLYGMLKPFDLIEAYRLEMGTSIPISRKKNLYEYWKKTVSTQLLNEIEAQEEKIILNLASNEYSNVLDAKLFKEMMVSPQFLDSKNGRYKVISFFAKKARGMMSRYILENKIDSLEGILGFSAAGYSYNPNLSKQGKPAFTREENQH